MNGPLIIISWDNSWLVPSFSVSPPLLLSLPPWISSYASSISFNSDSLYLTVNVFTSLLFHLFFHLPLRFLILCFPHLSFCPLYSFIFSYVFCSDFWFFVFLSFSLPLYSTIFSSISFEFSFFSLSVAIYFLFHLLFHSSLSFLSVYLFPFFFGRSSSFIFFLCFFLSFIIRVLTLLFFLSIPVLSSIASPSPSLPLRFFTFISLLHSFFLSLTSYLFSFLFLLFLIFISVPMSPSLLFPPI